MSKLCPCPACNRHVSVDEVACPFCAAPLSESFRCQPAPAPARGRLSRAAMFAAGAALVGAAACSDAQPQPQPLYGGSFPPPDGGVQADSGADPDADIPQPEYGAPFGPSGNPTGGGNQTR